jgi:uncharacterized membrane protein YdjX (TVP38/TMEM64 family)
MRALVFLANVAFIALVTGLVMGAAEASALEIAGFDVKRDLPALGIWAPIAIIGLRLMAALSGVVPSSPVLLAAGATEGILLGSVYVLIGAMAGALIAFLVGRNLGRGYVERKGWLDSLSNTKFGSWLLADDTSQTRLMAGVFYCRLIPGINLDALSYVAGATPIATWRFALATFGALLPYTILLVAIGNQLVKLGTTELVLVLFAILGITLMPVIVRVVQKRQAGSES